MPKEIRTAFPMFGDIDKVLDRVRKVLSSGRLMNGEFTRDFERRFSEKSGIPLCVSVNSCTTALEITLKYLQVAGGEVILPTNTFIVTGNSVIYAGAVPVLADIAEETYCLDPKEVERRLTPKTKAVIVVHIGGYIASEVEEIADICSRKGIPLIEDCAHASGAVFQGRHAGNFGYAGCFSFYPTKVITTGTGGMIATRDEGLASFASSVKLHGAGTALSDIVNMGNDWFMDELRAAIGASQMEMLDEFIEKRNVVAKWYDAMIASTDALRTFPVPKESIHSYYKYPVQVTRPVDVQAMKAGFKDKYGFELEAIYWPTCHLQPVYRKRFGTGEGMFPVAERIMSTQVTLPIHPAITHEEAEFAFKSLDTEVKRLSS